MNKVVDNSLEPWRNPVDKLYDQINDGYAELQYRVEVLESVVAQLLIVLNIGVEEA